MLLLMVSPITCVAEMGVGVAVSPLLPVLWGEDAGRQMRGSADLRFTYAFPISTPAANTSAPPSTT